MNDYNQACFVLSRATIGDREESPFVTSLERLEERLHQGPFSHPDTFCAFPFIYLLCSHGMRELYQGPPLFLTVSLSWLTIRRLLLVRAHYFLFCCVLAVKDGHYIDVRKGNIKYVKSQSGPFPPRRFNASVFCCTCSPCPVTLARRC